MNTNNHGLRLAAPLIGLICATTAGAQQLETENLDPSVQAASCAAVQWNKDMLANYPRIAEGCQEVVISDGRKWARFSADLVRNNRDGTVTLNFKNRRGGSMEDLTLLPAPEQRVSMDGRSYRLSELPRGQQLNLYVPEGMYGVALAAGAPPEQLVQIAPPATRAPLAQVAQTQGERAQLAQSDRTPRRLPDTAGPLPLVALGGLLCLFGGLVLSIKRRWLSPRTA
jgi:hypothetical protein